MPTDPVYKNGSKEGSLNGNEMIQKEPQDIKKEERTQWAKTWAYKTGFHSPLGFSKLCLMVEAKIIVLPDVIPTVCWGNIYKNYSIHGGG